MPTGLVPRTPPRRLVLPSVLAAALGVAGGAAAYVRRRQFEHDVLQPGRRLPWSHRAGRRA